MYIYINLRLTISSVLHLNFYLHLMDALLSIKFRPLPLIREENDEVQYINIDFYRLNQTNKSMKGIQKQKKPN